MDDPEREPLGVALEVRDPDLDGEDPPDAVCVPVLLLLDPPVGERLTLVEGVPDCEEPPEGLLDGVTLRVPDGVPDGVAVCEEPPEGLFDGVPLIEDVPLRLLVGVPDLESVPLRLPERVRDKVPERVRLGLIEGVCDCEEAPEAVVEDVPLPVALFDGVSLPVAEPVLESVRDLDPDRVSVLDGEGVDENDAPAESVAEHDASMARPWEAQHAKVVHSTGASDARGL